MIDWSDKEAKRKYIREYMRYYRQRHNYHFKPAESLIQELKAKGYENAEAIVLGVLLDEKLKDIGIIKGGEV